MNRLRSARSPYLRQHSANPVDWYPWGEEAFAAARVRDRPIFLSIGYASCYWCHVMEQDSFEDEEVAAALNNGFVSIKVDREERPDLDQLYMQAVVAMTGQGGWPLSVFLTAELEPFWGGTFFYRTRFLEILHTISQVWNERRRQIMSSALALKEHLSSRLVAEKMALPDAGLLDAAYDALSRSFDPVWGGFGGAPKFPPSLQIGLLLRMSDRVGAGRMAHKTLRCMAQGGLYDHLGGGFHRYSVDAKWHVPHFEKMLYDNALLVSTYVEGFQATGDFRFAEVARETLEFVLRELTSLEGGFYAALDAGQPGREGEFYVWTRDEIKAALSYKEFAACEEFFALPEEGNFERGKIVLNLREDVPSRLIGMSLFQEVRRKLWEVRCRREPPFCDQKIITAWNGLMISALARAYRALGDQRYLAAALRCMGFIRDKMLTSEGLFRCAVAGEAYYKGCVEDYAFIIGGLIDLYACEFDPELLRLACLLQDLQDEKFWDKCQGGYVFSEASDLILKQKEYLDGALPSGNSAALLNLLRLGALYPGRGYAQRADELLTVMSGTMAAHPFAFPAALQGLWLRRRGITQVGLIGSRGEELCREVITYVNRHFMPGVMLALSEAQVAGAPEILEGKDGVLGKPAMYICKGNVCSAPLAEHASMALAAEVMMVQAT